ncbi:MAG: hypothetical protein O6757_01235, partial [Alphaproteobacteria bacterium]|nr:hypothetical protein [Alphaproteobacteria bacterium]
MRPDGIAENLGGIANDSNKGTATFATASRDFALMITAEPIVTVRGPGELVVFFSGTPKSKDAQPRAFNFAGLSDRGGRVSTDNDSIAGMTFKGTKTPLALIQAEKAVELLDRFDARNFDRSGYEQAMTSIAEARELKGKKQADAAARAIVAAGQALSKTATMMEAAEKAANEA